MKTLLLSLTLLAPTAGLARASIDNPALSCAPDAEGESLIVGPGAQSDRFVYELPLGRGELAIGGTLLREWLDDGYPVRLQDEKLAVTIPRIAAADLPADEVRVTIVHALERNAPETVICTKGPAFRSLLTR